MGLITYGTRLLLFFLLKQSLKTILSWFYLRRSQTRGAAQIVQTPDFCVLQNTPAPPLLCLVRNRRVGKGVRRIAPCTIKSRGGGHRLILSPSLSKVFFCCCFFFNVVIILCWRRNTIEPREKKQATVKLVISTATITRESNIISTGRFREVWLKFYFFSLLVSLSCCWCPYSLLLSVFL